MTFIRSSLCFLSWHWSRAPHLLIFLNVKLLRHHWRWESHLPDCFGWSFLFNFCFFFHLLGLGNQFLLHHIGLNFDFFMNQNLNVTENQSINWELGFSSFDFSFRGNWRAFAHHFRFTTADLLVLELIWHFPLWCRRLISLVWTSTSFQFELLAICWAVLAERTTWWNLLLHFVLLFLLQNHLLVVELLDCFDINVLEEVRGGAFSGVLAE